MKILHLSSETSWRGGEQQMAYLIGELKQRGIPPLVACRQKSSFLSYARQQGWHYSALPFSNSFDVKTAWGIRQMCARNKVDLVHIHSGKSHGIAALSAVLGNTTPFILSRRVDFPVRDNRLTQWKYNHAQIKKIICVSHAIETIVRGNIKNPERCTTVHSGIDPNRFSSPTGYLRTLYSLPETSWLIGNTSALANHKDYFTFVDTAEIVIGQQPQAHFFIIGDGPDRQAIESYVAEKQLTGRIHFTGFLDNINEVLPELDILLMTSQTEGLGTSVLDAFACRIPVVATAAGGIPEMVKHRETGLLAPVKAAPQLAQHVLAYFHSPDLREEVSSQAYQLMQTAFSSAVMAEKTLNVYLKPLAQN